ncbi:hypothetical protein GCM10010492_62610 [Saccharothrix mutabilis subsp. mutabilis]|uniref:Uncharacterized protein n=1 Tax=Saccharothrix mutabilis subsp. mutabilis TaxID=66855 RepID=A0ABN0UKB3_9PSEU
MAVATTGSPGATSTAWSAGPVLNVTGLGGGVEDVLVPATVEPLSVAPLAVHPAATTATNPTANALSVPRRTDIPVASLPLTTPHRVSPYKVTPGGLTSLPEMPDRYAREVPLG